MISFFMRTQSELSSPTNLFLRNHQTTVHNLIKSLQYGYDNHTFTLSPFNYVVSLTKPLE